MFGHKEKKEISLLIIDSQCTGCGRCAGRCRRDVIEIAEQGGHRWAWVVRPEACKACGNCQKVCPHDAIRIMTKKIVA